MSLTQRDGVSGRRYRAVGYVEAKIRRMQQALAAVQSITIWGERGRPASRGARFRMAGLGMITSMRAGFQCAGCGEWNETAVDSSAGTKQSYVEDCQVCCKPNLLKISWDSTAREYVVWAELE